MHRRSGTLLYLPLLAGALAAQGCQSLGTLLADVPRPTARLRGVEVQDLSLERALLALDVEVSNPYSVPLPLADLDYALSSGASELLSGRAELSRSIPPAAASSVTVPAEVRFGSVLGAIGGLRPGQVVPYTVVATLTADAPGLGPVSLPLEKDGELPIPAVPEVDLLSIDWGTVSFEQVSATLNLRIFNPNAFAAELQQLSYDLSLGGEPIAETSVRQVAALAPGAAQDLRLPITFRPLSLGRAALDIIGGERATYGLAGVMSFDTPFGPVDFPYQRSGETTFRR